MLFAALSVMKVGELLSLGVYGYMASLTYRVAMEELPRLDEYAEERVRQEAELRALNAAEQDDGGAGCEIEADPTES
jgi:hypothetical protein